MELVLPQPERELVGLIYPGPGSEIAHELWELLETVLDQHGYDVVAEATLCGKRWFIIADESNLTTVLDLLDQAPCQTLVVLARLGEADPELRRKLFEHPRLNGLVFEQNGDPYRPVEGWTQVFRVVGALPTTRRLAGRKLDSERWVV